MSAVLPAGWDPVAAGDRVLRGLVTVTAPQVKGAHDAALALVGEHAYVAAEVNDVREGESDDWPEIYCALSIIHRRTLAVEAVIPLARSGQRFGDDVLPHGQCFVPRLLPLDARTLRCFFASQDPGRRQAQTRFVDLDLATRAVLPRLGTARLRTAAGVAAMEPRHLHADAAAQGFRGPARDSGLYILDAFKRFDGRRHAMLNNFLARQNALAVLEDDDATFAVVGHCNEPQAREPSEAAANRLPDGTWLAICRHEAGGYGFAASRDGRRWTPRAIPGLADGGEASKPTFDRFGGVYYLGWQEATRVGGVPRSVFNLEVSRDGARWERAYRFASARSFQYPVFAAHDGAIHLAVTEGEPGRGGKVRIRFGTLEEIRP